MLELWWLVAALLILAVLSVFDIRTRKIPVTGFAVVFILAVMYRLYSGGADLTAVDIIWSFTPGLMLVALSLLTGGKLGIGDGILIMEIGLGVGLTRCICVLMGALIFSFIYSGSLLVLRKARRESEIPFVPFITVGMGVMALVCR